MEDQPIMRDSESDFLYRYDWGRGEREMRPVLRQERLSRFLRSMFGSGFQNFALYSSGIIVALFILVAFISQFFVYAGGPAHAADIGDRLGAVQKNYDVSVVWHSEAEGVDKPLHVALSGQTKELACGLPSSEELSKKVSLSCENGVTVQPKQESHEINTSGD